MIDLIAVIVCTLLVELLVYAEQRVKHVAKKDSKYVILFLMVSVYACRIPVHSVVYRLLAETGAGLPAQEILIGTVVVILSYLLRKLLVIYWKENSEKFFFYTASLVFLFNILVFVIWGNVTNEIFFGSYLFSGLLTLCVLKKRPAMIEFPGTQEYKNRWKVSLPVSLFFSFTFLLYLPSELYLGNPTYFKVSYFSFIVPLLITMLVFEIVYVILTNLLMTEKQYLICNVLIFIFVLLSNLQAIFLNGKLKILDGVEQTWTVIEIVFNIAIWVILLICICIWAWRNIAKVKVFIKGVCFGGIIMQVVSLMILSMMVLPTVKVDNFGLSTDKILELSKKDNVVVFVLDWFDNQIMEQILDKDETFLDPLDGFVYYRNTTSKYAFTGVSVPYMLTGVEREAGQSDQEYVAFANEKSDVLEQLNSAGYGVGIYTEGGLVGYDERAFVLNGCKPVLDIDVQSERRSLAKITRYKSFPFFLKKIFPCTEDDIDKMYIWDSDIEYFNPSSNLQFARKVFDEGITVNQKKTKEFRFIHILGAHAPYTLCENYQEGKSDYLTQSKLSFNIVIDFLKQMKECNIYKDATIIITADHGQNCMDRAGYEEMVEELQLKMISSPIMFVKMPGDECTPLKISEKPVSHTELVPTILKGTVGNTGKYGRTFDEISEDDRERTFFLGNDSLPFVKYIINGDVMDEESWSEPIPLENE